VVREEEAGKVREKGGGEEGKEKKGKDKIRKEEKKLG
jgi:hypothetical protein